MEKNRILALVAKFRLPRTCALAQLGLAKSTYYRWLTRRVEIGLEEGDKWDRLNIRYE